MNPYGYGKVREVKEQKKTKIIYLFLIMLFAASVIVGCGTNKEEFSQVTEVHTKEGQVQSVRIAAMTGSTAIGMVKLMADSQEEEAPYEFEIYGTADEISTKLIQGELDMAAIPCNLASVLYNKTDGEIQIAAVNTLGVLYIVEIGEEIWSVEDLRGKTIYSTGQGTTPEYALNFLLNSYGINPKTDVTIEYKSEAAEVAAVLAESESAVAMLPQPYVTVAMTKNPNLRMALSVTEEWEAVNDGDTIVTGVLVLRKEFAKQNPTVVLKFLEEYKESIRYANEEVDNCARLVEQFGIFKEAIAKTAIPYCNITMLTENEMQQKVTAYLKTLYEQNPNSVGGTFPDADIFYQSVP